MRMTPHSTVYCLLLISLSCVRPDSSIVDRILKDYNREVRPYGPYGKATDVSLEMLINQMGSISAVHMEFMVDTHLRERWTDPRLAFDEYSNNSIELYYGKSDAIWIPRAYFKNLKTATTHDITVPNIYISISPHGHVTFVRRYNLFLSCNMELQYFPMDYQTCSIAIESYAHTNRHVQYSWREVKNPVYFDKNMELAEFNKDVAISYDNCSRVYVTGTFPCVKVNFVLHREFGFYLTQSFVPSILIVMLSWVSFWLDPNATPARISLGLLTVLTITTQASGGISQLPKVSYIKAIDVWMAVNLSFVFAGLVEFAIVNVQCRRERVEEDKKILRKGDMNSNGNAKSGKAYNVEGVDKSSWEQISALEVHYRTKLSSTIDKACRVLFPLAYLIFNLVFWLIYLRVLSK